jgi:hypothetical protein
MNRRTFVEALGAVCLTANGRLLRGAGILNSDVPDDVAAKALVPVPSTVAGVEQPVMSLGGEWRVNMDPPAEFWKTALDTSWTKMNVPNEFATQRFSIVPNREYPCRRTIRIPADFANQRIFLRFDGVYSFARVWVNGIYVRDHFGGFTAWDCEITDHVKPGEDADLVVGVTDRSDDISQESYYAKHPIGGILRDVRLFAVPRDYLRSLAVTVGLDDKFQDGRIHLAAELSSGNVASGRLEVKVTDDSGRALALQPGTIPFAPRSESANADIAISAPKHWDGEHPNTYMLEVSLVIGNAVAQSVRRRIGFRTVKREGNQLLVNGRPVKLRGVCRHSIHPIYGRAVPPEFDEMDAKLLRAGHINFVRTSHYPPSEQFLDACDRHGIYLEEETAVCWSNVENGPSSDPEFTARFMDQFRDMIGRDRDHASVLFWSLGNESQWGSNFAQERRFAAKHDPSRPTIFSYPETTPLPPPVDIFSKHYASVNSDLSSSTNPVLNDEFAHVSCYNLATLRRDPGVRSYWGQSIKQFGEKFISSDGCLGGSIWAGIDEIFLLPDGPAGYGPWGVIDGWRREKPEYWLTKKAYSPIRIDDRPIAAPVDGVPLAIPIRNAFDHTDLNEIEIRWSRGSGTGSAASQELRVNLPPHQSGYLEIPAQPWKAGDMVQLDFLRGGVSIDRFKLPVGMGKPPVVRPKPAAVKLEQSGGRVVVTGPHFSISFSGATGLIADARFDSQPVIAGGPYVDLGTGPLTQNWLLRKFEAAADGDGARIYTSGEFKDAEGIESYPVELEITIDGTGLITTLYRLHGYRQEASQLGIAFVLPQTVEKLAWKRTSLWSVYPEDHIGRPQGSALKQPKHAALSYGAKPEWPWSEDVGDFFLWGKEGHAPQASNDFRSLKENIWWASCILAGGAIRVRAESDAGIAARAGVLPNGQVTFSLYNFWAYPDLEWGNYTGTNTGTAITTHEVKVRLTDMLEEG